MVVRRCPDCKATLPPGSGVKFDDAHNVLCAYCGGVVLPAEAEKEKPDKKKANSPIYDSETNTFIYGRGFGPSPPYRHSGHDDPAYAQFQGYHE